MAHGKPHINICEFCNQYIEVARFSKNPVCPDCGNESKQSSKDYIRQKYKLSIFYIFKNSQSIWTKII